MSERSPSAWLRGPIPGIVPALQPAAHALTAVLEELGGLLSTVEPERLWSRPGDSASIGYHVAHLTGSLERLYAYARGESLTAAGLERLERERTWARAAETGAGMPTREALLDDVRRAIEAALDQLRRTPGDVLAEPRAVGRAGLPSTVVGLLFHGAEHAVRHSGQAVTVAKALRCGTLNDFISTPSKEGET